MQKLNEKLNIGLALVMVIMIIPGFFAFSHSKKVNHQPKIVIKKISKKTETNLWTTLPRQAAAYKELSVYSDVNLTRKVGEISAKTRLNLTELSKKAFKLSDGNYISAQKNLVISDVPITVKKTNLTLYSNKTVRVFYSPLTTYEDQILTTLSGNQIISSDKMTKTHWGTFYEILLKNGEKGWVSSSDISLQNPKMVQLQQLLNQKYNQPNYSIYVKELNSKFTVGVNENEEMYSASLSKLPILYWVQKKLNEGEITLTDQLLYSSSVNGWFGSFEPAGTGTLPKAANNKEYTLQDVIDRTAKESDNVGSNLLSYYETQKFNPTYQKEINKIAGANWNPEVRDASSQMVGKMLEALYHEGGYCFDALFNTAFDNIKIKAGVPSNIPVAHKIGDADSYNHDAAIVFANVPYVLVIETNGATNQQIQNISQDVYGVLK